MNEKQRAAFDRVANRIKEQSERVQKPITIDEARRELAKHLTEADNRKRR
jgi:ribosomal protein L29